MKKVNVWKIVKIIILLVVLIGIIIGIYLGVKYISESANKINEEYEKDKELLETNYDSFNTYITEYNEVRTELATLLEKAMYYEDFPKLSEEIATFYTDYDELINEIGISVKNMDTACERTYMEEDAEEKCSTYGAIYEQLINVYISDINTYNELINNYNTWKGEEKYQVFVSQYVTDYIDYNNDGIYEGKVENNEE